MVLALAYILYYLCVTWLQLWKDKMEFNRVCSDRDIYVILTLGFSINSSKNYKSQTMVIIKLEIYKLSTNSKIQR